MPHEQHIHCSVDNCHYWGSGNTCEANEIFVASDQLVRNATDNLDAPHAAVAVPTPVASSAETACKTFVRHGSGEKVKADGVTRLS